MRLLFPLSLISGPSCPLSTKGHIAAPGRDHGGGSISLTPPSRTRRPAASRSRGRDALTRSPTCIYRLHRSSFSLLLPLDHGVAWTQQSGRSPSKRSDNPWPVHPLSPCRTPCYERFGDRFVRCALFAITYRHLQKDHDRPRLAPQP